MRISDWSSDVCSSDLQQKSRLDRLRLGRRQHSRLLLVARSLRASQPKRHKASLRQKRAQLVSFRDRRTRGRRSEEHTSELQSLMRISYAVFCLKKKKTQQTYTTN